MNFLAVLNKKSARPPFGYSGAPMIVEVLIVIVSIVALGAAILMSSSVLVALLPIGAVVLYLFTKRPELGIFAIVAMVASIIFEGDLPLLPVPGGSLHLSDLVLIALVGRILVNSMSDGRLRYLKTPLDYPVLLFILAASISAVISIVKYGLDPQSVVRSLRAIIYYLLIIVITNLVRERKQIRILTRCLLGISAVVALMMLIQARLGRSVRLLPGRIEGDANYWTTRIIPPGEVLVFVMFISMICALVIRKRPFFKTTQFYLIPILGGGILLTYNRQYWVSIVLSLFIFFLLLSTAWKRRFLSWLALGLVLFIVVILPVTRLSKTARVYSDSIAARFSSLLAVKRTFASGSLEWRKYENQYALRSFVKNPILGIGLSNTYRPPLPGMDMETGWDTKRFIHNGYLFVLVNMGVLGFLPLVWLYFLFLSRGLAKWRRIHNLADRAVVIGFTMSGLALAFSILFEPRVMQWHGIVVISTIMGLNEAIIHLNENESLDKTTSGGS